MIVERSELASSPALGRGWGWGAFNSPFSWPACLAGVFLLALSLRGVYLLEWAGHPFFSTPIGDGRKFYAWAQEIAGGDWLGREVFFHAPLYPYVLGVAFKVFGDNLWVPRLLQIVLGAASCVLVAAAARRLFDSRRVGALAGLGLACYAPIIFIDAVLQKTALGVFLGSLALLLWACFRDRPTRALALPMGAVLAAAALVHEASLAWLAISLLWFGVGFPATPLRHRLGWCLALLLGAALLLVPVGLRNQHLGGQFLITTYNFGTNFWYGNQPGADGHHQGFAQGRGDAEFEGRDTIELAQRELGRPVTPAQASRFWTGKALQYIGQHPAQWTLLTLRKLNMALYWYEWPDTDSQYAYADRSRLLTALQIPFNFLTLLTLAAIGFAATLARWRSLWPLYLAVLAILASLALFVVFARYRAPLLPILWMFAGAGLVALGQRLRHMAGMAPLLGAAAAALLLAGINFTGFVPTSQADGKAVNYHAVGLRLTDSGDYAAAEQMFRAAMSLTPTHAFPHFALSRIYDRQGRVGEQINALRRGLALDPGNRQARRVLAQALQTDAHQALMAARLRTALGRYDEALAAAAFLTQEEYRAAGAMRGLVAAICQPSAVNPAGALLLLGEQRTPDGMAFLDPIPAETIRVLVATLSSEPGRARACSE